MNRRQPRILLDSRTAPSGGQVQDNALVHGPLMRDSLTRSALIRIVARDGCQVHPSADVEDADPERACDRCEDLARGILAAALDVRDVLHAHAARLSEAREGQPLSAPLLAQRRTDELTQQRFGGIHARSLRRGSAVRAGLCCERKRSEPLRHPVMAFCHADLADEAEIRARFARVYVCRRVSRTAVSGAPTLQG